MRYELGRCRHEISTAVIAIDGDVFLREVARQHPVAALAEPASTRLNAMRKAARRASLALAMRGAYS